MSKTFATPILFDQAITAGSIINLSIEPVSSLPAANSSNKGKLLYLTTDDKLYYSNGSSWVSVAGSGITYTGTSPINVTGTVISITNATTGVDGSMSSTDKTKLDGATDSTTANTLVIRDASGRTKFVDPSANQDAATKNYVDTQISNNISGLLDMKGAHDASTGAYPTGASKGDAYFISVAGTISGTIYEIGDFIIANIDSPTSSDWTKLQVNLTVATTTVQGVVELSTDAEAQALSSSTVVITPSNLGALSSTETQKGIASIATLIELGAGTDDTKIVTPSKIISYLNSKAFAHYEQQNLTATSSNTYTITHSLGQQYVKVIVFDSANREVDVAITCTSTTQFDIGASLTSGSTYVVKIIG